MFYQPIEHTADIGFKVWGKDLEELFAHAARALTDQMIEVPDTEAKKTVFVRLKARTREELLVKWLEEILFQFETTSLIGLGFTVTRCDPDDFRATIHGIDWDPALHPLKTGIKAVTFHEMEIHKKGDQFEVQIILDV